VEAPRAPSLDTGDGVFDDDALFTGKAQQPSRVLVGGRAGLARQAFGHSDDTVHHHREIVREPGGLEHRDGVA
jgi:hypothetical protein